MHISSFWGFAFRGLGSSLLSTKNWEQNLRFFHLVVVPVGWSWVAQSGPDFVQWGDQFPNLLLFVPKWDNQIKSPLEATHRTFFSVFVLLRAVTKCVPSRVFVIFSEPSLEHQHVTFPLWCAAQGLQRKTYTKYILLKIALFPNPSYNY